MEQSFQNWRCNLHLFTSLTLPLPVYSNLFWSFVPCIVNFFFFRSGCPWSFVNFLTIKVGSHVAPEGTYHHLKLGILLSLAVSKVEIKRFGGSLSYPHVVDRQIATKLGLQVFEILQPYKDKMTIKWCFHLLDSEVPAKKYSQFSLDGPYWPSCIARNSETRNWKIDLMLIFVFVWSKTFRNVHPQLYCIL